MAERVLTFTNLATNEHVHGVYGESQPGRSGEFAAPNPTMRLVTTGRVKTGDILREREDGSRYRVGKTYPVGRKMVCELVKEA
jgi:hypothetical protein